MSIVRTGMGKTCHSTYIVAAVSPLWGIFQMISSDIGSWSKNL